MISLNEVVEKYCEKREPGNLKKEYPDFFSFEIAANREYDSQRNAEYPKIDLEFLRMRDEEGWPAFAVFQSGADSCFFETIVDGYTGYINKRNIRISKMTDISTSFHSCIRVYFEDIFEKLRAISVREIKNSPPHQRKRDRTIWGRAKIRQYFGGMIPTKTREKIISLRKEKLIDNWFLIAESVGWQLNSEKYIQPRTSDPIVVGWSNRWDVMPEFILIDHFDQTDLEEMVRREFSAGNLE